MRILSKNDSQSFLPRALAFSLIMAKLSHICLPMLVTVSISDVLTYLKNFVSSDLFDPVVRALPFKLHLCFRYIKSGCKWKASCAPPSHPRLAIFQLCLPDVTTANRFPTTLGRATNSHAVSAPSPLKLNSHWAGLRPTCPLFSVSINIRLVQK